MSKLKVSWKVYIESFKDWVGREKRKNDLWVTDSKFKCGSNVRNVGNSLVR